MLVVMFTTRASKSSGSRLLKRKNGKGHPKAIRNTVAVLVGLYVVFIILLLPIVPTQQ
jgi:hypothetical protein